MQSWTPGHFTASRTGRTKSPVVVLVDRRKQPLWARPPEHPAGVEPVSRIGGMTSNQENRRPSELEMREHASSVMQRLRRVRHIVPRDPLVDLAANAAETVARRRGTTLPYLKIFAV